MKVANTFQPNDRVILTVVAQQAGRKSLSVAETLDGEGYRLNGLGNRFEAAPAADFSAINTAQAPKNAAPQFDTEGYVAAVRQYGVFSAEATGIQTKHALAIEAFRAANPEQEADDISSRIVDTVLAYSSAAHGYSLTDSTAYFVDKTKIVVNAPIREGDKPVTWALTIAPVWGK